MIQLPSQFAIGDKVHVTLDQKQKQNFLTGVITAVHFTISKVKYDIDIPIYDELSTRIYNIDSCFVKPFSTEIDTVNENPRTKELVSFGSYLLKTYGIKDEGGNPKQVSHADLENYTAEANLPDLLYTQRRTEEINSQLFGADTENGQLKTVVFKDGSYIHTVNPTAEYENDENWLVTIDLNNHNSKPLNTN